MSANNYQVRRATLDDLVSLRKVWKHAQLPVGELEKRLTEFQIVETPDGRFLGSIALQIEAAQGYIHSETFEDRESEAELRLRFWERIQSVSRNHGLARLWTRETAPFWKSLGFQQPSQESPGMASLPARFGTVGPEWLTLQLKDDAAVAVSLDHEFELFKQSQQQLSQRAMNQARLLRTLAGVVAILGLGLVLVATWYVLRRLPMIPRP